MDGRWKNVFGRIEKGKKFTRFELEVELSNGLKAFRRVTVGNHELLYSRINMYKWVLDGMIRSLEPQVCGDSRSDYIP